MCHFGYDHGEGDDRCNVMIMTTMMNKKLMNISELVGVMMLKIIMATMAMKLVFSSAVS